MRFRSEFFTRNSRRGHGLCRKSAAFRVAKRSRPGPAPQLPQEVAGHVGRHGRGPHQSIEMAREHAYVLDCVEGEEHLTDVDHRPLGPEHRVGNGEVGAAVEEEHAERGVELVDQRDHVVELLTPGREREVAPDALGACEGFQGLARLADLDVRLRQPHIGEAAVGDGDGPVGRSRGEVAIFVVQHLFGLHQVRQRRRHVADLVADRPRRTRRRDSHPPARRALSFTSTDSSRMSAPSFGCWLRPSSQSRLT